MTPNAVAIVLAAICFVLALAAFPGLRDALPVIVLAAFALVGLLSIRGSLLLWWSRRQWRNR